MRILWQLSGNWGKIQSDRMSHVTPVLDSDRTGHNKATSNGMIRGHPVPFKLRLLWLHFRFDIRHCMHAYGTHNARRTMGNAPKSVAHGDLLVMTPAAVRATAAAVAVAAARVERNNIRGFWTRQGRQSISGLPCAIPPSSSSSKTQTKAKLSLITHQESQTSSSSYLISHLI